MGVLLPPGSLVSASRSTTGTLLTIPAGQRFSGNCVLSGTITLAGTCNPTVTVAGTNAEPAEGSVVHQLSLSGLALTTANNSATVDVHVRAPAGNAITLQFTQGAAGSSSVTLNGYIY